MRHSASASGILKAPLDFCTLRASDPIFETQPIVFGFLLIPGGDSAELLEPVDCPLHQIALPVQGPVERTGASFVGFPGDGVANSPPSEIGPNPATAVPFVAADPLGLDAGTATPGASYRSLGHQLFEHAGLVPLTRGQHECHRLALTLDSQMDFGPEPSPGTAQRLITVPLFAPAAC